MNNEEILNREKHIDNEEIIDELDYVDIEEFVTEEVFVTKEKVKICKKKARIRKLKKKKRLLKGILISFGVLMLTLLVGFVFMREVGKFKLKMHAGDDLPILHLVMENQIENDYLAQTEEELKEGQILYGNKIYEYNENIMTFLCLGVDSRQINTEEKIPGEAGQADTIMLIVLNPDTKIMKMIHISRDTMAKVDVYDTDGNYRETKDMQIALQFAYGDGEELSCDLMESAVSNLFYGIPIHGYGAIDIHAVGDLNDAIGGVELTVIEDLSKNMPDLFLGNTLTMSGEQALWYVQARESGSEELGSNNLRINRQKDFLAAFVDQVIKELTSDITIGIDLYQIALEHMITSIGLDQVTYLSTLILDYTFAEEDMISVDGSIHLEDVFEEFIIDEEALYELIIDVFYKEVS